MKRWFEDWAGKFRERPEMLEAIKKYRELIKE